MMSNILVVCFFLALFSGIVAIQMDKEGGSGKPGIVNTMAQYFGISHQQDDLKIAREQAGLNKKKFFQQLQGRMEELQKQADVLSSSADNQKVLIEQTRQNLAQQVDAARIQVTDPVNSNFLGVKNLLLNFEDQLKPANEKAQDFSQRIREHQAEINQQLQELRAVTQAASDRNYQQFAEKYWQLEQQQSMLAQERVKNVENLKMYLQDMDDKINAMTDRSREQMQMLKDRAVSSAGATDTGAAQEQRQRMSEAIATAIQNTKDQNDRLNDTIKTLNKSTQDQTRQLNDRIEAAAQDTKFQTQQAKDDVASGIQSSKDQAQQLRDRATAGAAADAGSDMSYGRFFEQLNKFEKFEKQKLKELDADKQRISDMMEQSKTKAADMKQRLDEFIENSQIKIRESIEQSKIKAADAQQRTRDLMDNLRQKMEDQRMKKY